MPSCSKASRTFHRRLSSPILIPLVYYDKQASLQHVAVEISQATRGRSVLSCARGVRHRWQMLICLLIAHSQIEGYAGGQQGLYAQACGQSKALLLARRHCASKLLSTR